METGEVRSLKGPGSGNAIRLEEPRPVVAVDGGGVRVGLEGDGFEVGAVGKAGERHLGDGVSVGAAVDGGDADGIERRADRLEVAPGDGDVVDLEVGRGKKRREE